MHEKIIQIKQAIDTLKDVVDSIEHGVIHGGTCAACGRSATPTSGANGYQVSVDSVLIPLVKPEYCDKCFIRSICWKENVDNSFDPEYCEKLWTRLIDDNKRKN